jgi:hypothetical protein
MASTPPRWSFRGLRRKLAAIMFRRSNRVLLRSLVPAAFALLAVAITRNLAAAGAGPVVDERQVCSDFYPVSGWRWRLSGIAVGPDERSAVFARVGESRGVHEGERIDAWTATEIQPHQIFVTCFGLTRTLSPESMSPEETAVVVAAHAAEVAAIDQRVDAALRHQDQEQEQAEDSLAAATRAMTGQR